MKLNIKNGRDGVSPSVNNGSATCQPSRHQRGVALVITLVMLSVITFMAITFLVLSRRERGSVTTATDQTVSRFTADTALERAKAEMLGNIIAFTNAQNYDLLVSTNFINYHGFDPAAVDYRTNVNYDYLASGGAVVGNNALLNLNNLLFNPRPPVFITNITAAKNEFRFYLDLNRNGQYDTNGFWPVISSDPLNPYINAATGLPVPVTFAGAVLSNHFVGDPEWIGVLEFPERPHSPTNRFLARYAYIVQPVGKTLDLNYIHNRAKRITFTDEGFLRNQGVGTWEMNLAAFLADLNTNQWGYSYTTNLTGSSGGFAFNDANSLLTYRYNGGYGSLNSANNLLGGGAAPFTADNIDQYTDGPLQDGTALPGENDVVNQSWSGADNLNHFFTTQDLFDPTKTARGVAGSNFVDRLSVVGTQTNSYDRYTYYRLLSQLGTESVPEQDKININYRNMTNGIIVPGMETNLYAWSPLDFFTNAAHAMFKQLKFTDADTNLITITNIPVYPTNYYTPAVHRILQLAANIYDSTTTNFYPCVYRPYFSANGTNIFISGFELVNGDDNLATATGYLTIPLDIGAATNRSLITSKTQLNLYDVPWVIGAKKGLPNLNAIALQTIAQTTRKLQVTRPTTKPTTGWSGYHTKQLFLVGVSNAVAVEMWNSYQTNYPRSVYLQADGIMLVSMTNNYGYQLTRSFPFAGSRATNQWKGTNLKPGSFLQPKAQSFIIPLQTNILVLPDAFFTGSQLYIASSNSAADWNIVAADAFPQPDWSLSVTNHLRCMILDGGVNGRVVDYVELNGLNTRRDLGQELIIRNNKLGVWTVKTNSGYFDTQMPEGVINQFGISLGSINTTAKDWNDNGLDGNNKGNAISGFSNFVYNTTVSPSTTTAQVPFTPTAKIYETINWQANDPLVHYTLGDLTYTLAATNNLILPPNGFVPSVTNTFLRLNDRFDPWGGYGPKSGGVAGFTPTMYDIALKDPMIWTSDSWNFLTTKFPAVGWLGRVHRGTPWQTVYLKSPDVGIPNPTLPITSPADWIKNYPDSAKIWSDWTGNTNLGNAFYTRPAQDRNLLDVFTTALNPNTTRGQLSVNIASSQTNNLYAGLAAWSAALSGVIILSNSPSGIVPVPIDPAGAFDPSAPSSLAQIVQGINQTRTNTGLFPNQVFNSVGDVLATPQLTELSPFIGDTNNVTDEVYERIPQQIMSLLTASPTPRFVIYSYGQTLHPADHSLVIGTALNGLCTNYQITAETATRAVVRVEGAPQNPKIVVEQFNVLPPD